MRFFLILLGLIPFHLFSQWSYIGRINDDCSPSFTYNYTYSNNSNSGGHGASYSLFRDGKTIKSGSGDMGCCSVGKLKVFTDSIVFLVINDAGISRCSRTTDAGNNWIQFNNWTDIDLADIHILNKNTGYVLSRGVYFDNTRISIKRISDIEPRYLVQDDTVNTLVPDVYLTDTIFGDSYCPNIHKIGFKIKKNGIDINYHINISQIPLNIMDADSIHNIEIYPNPTDDWFSIKSKTVSSIKIFNNIGQLLTEVLIDSTHAFVDLRNYNSGVYFISFYNKNMYIVTKKIIKK